MVTAGSELFRIVRDSRLELDADIPETDLAAVKAGMSAKSPFREGGRDDRQRPHRHLRGQRHQPPGRGPHRPVVDGRLPAGHVRPRHDRRRRPAGPGRAVGLGAVSARTAPAACSWSTRPRRCISAASPSWPIRATAWPPPA
ncbi:HlyD family efflux transporter periplasmic adaptor subunit [Caulobacter segnis]